MTRPLLLLFGAVLAGCAGRDAPPPSSRFSAAPAALKSSKTLMPENLVRAPIAVISVRSSVISACSAEPSDVVFDARDNDADGWRPTQVPRPTYAMKERAPQTEVAPAPTVEDLPFDGLALDEDLEELPAVYRAG